MNFKSLLKYFRSLPRKNTPTTENNKSDTSKSDKEFLSFRHKAPLSRVDLLASLLQGDQQVTTLIASELGLKHQQKPDSNRQNKSSSATQQNVVTKTSIIEAPLSSNPTPHLKGRYWRLVKQKHRQDDTTEQQLEEKNTVNETISQPLPRKTPDYPTLTTLKDLRSRIFPLLEATAQAKQQLDLPATINKLSRAEFIQHFPQKPRLHSLQALQIIDDRQVHLTPYWPDHTWITEQLYQSFASYQISRAVLLNGEIQPLQITEQFALTNYQLPPENTPILLLSDLGRLSTGASSRVTHFNHKQRQYRRLLNELASQGNPIIVLTPCQPKGYPYVMRDQVQIVAWERQAAHLSEPKPSTADKNNDDQISQWVNTLLTLASPSIRLEPALLRCLRHSLRQYGERIPAAIESLVWQHPSIKEPHNVAATWRREANAAYRLLFNARTKDEQVFALQIVQQWHGALPEEIWFEELLTMQPLLTDDVIVPFKADLQAATIFLQNIITQNKMQGEKAEAYQAWVARLERRVSEKAVQMGVATHLLQSLFVQLDPTKTMSPSGYALDPALAMPSHLPKKKAWLCQVGHQWGVVHYVPTAVPKQKSSVLGVIEYAHTEMVWIKQNGKAGVIVLPETLGSEFVLLEQSNSLQTEQCLILKTDHTELHFDTFERPTWASEVGRDAYGLYADLLIPHQAKNVLVQRFRWIAAGAFMMGSPESEAELYAEHEDYHQVIISKGYWLADSTVTQAVWQAIMNDNPSHFKGENNPVEHVSWNGIQGFIQQLNQTLAEELGQSILQLPTEAQWEYACRAGTTTPFSFGENITPKQVNYNGEYPYHQGEKGLNRAKTVSVKSLPINPWGLYEMHGNVYEWCADAWQESLGTERVIEPYQAGDEDARRVVRGGSWNGFGRYVRSADRYPDSPDNRNGRIGFRLSLGREL